MHFSAAPGEGGVTDWSPENDTFKNYASNKSKIPSSGDTAVASTTQKSTPNFSKPPVNVAQNSTAKPETPKVASIQKSLDYGSKPEAPKVAKTPEPETTKVASISRPAGMMSLGATVTSPFQQKTYSAPSTKTSDSSPGEIVRKSLSGIYEELKLKTSNAKVLQKDLAATKSKLTQLKRQLKKCEPMDEQSEVQKMDPKDADAMGFGEPTQGSKTFTYTYPKEKGESVRQKIERFKQQDKDIQNFQNTVKQKGLKLD